MTDQSSDAGVEATPSRAGMTPHSPREVTR